jgi:hypothetical protein
MRAPRVPRGADVQDVVVDPVGVDLPELALDDALPGSAGAALLSDMGELVGDQLTAGRAGQAGLTAAQEDVLPAGEGPGLDVAAEAVGRAVGVQPGAAEIGAESPFHRGTDGVRYGLAAAPGPLDALLQARGPGYGPGRAASGLNTVPRPGGAPHHGLGDPVRLTFEPVAGRPDGQLRLYHRLLHELVAVAALQRKQRLACRLRDVTTPATRSGGPYPARACRQAGLGGGRGEGD